MESYDRLRPPHPLLYEPLVRRALEEDLGRTGDLTTEAVVPAGTTATAEIVARAAGRIAGLEVAASAFRLLDPDGELQVGVPDGQDAEAGQTLATIRANARALLAAERTALNFLGRLCGIATSTRDLVARVEAFGTRVVCTRKTSPGLRLLEKYAVRAGGGYNHRFGLGDAVLIKDNHKIVAGGITAAVERVQAAVGHLVMIEVEVDSLEELQEALRLEGIDAVLLDNLPLSDLRRGVELARGKLLTEASGGIRPENAQEIAATGVDLISVGWLTHSAPALDLSLQVTGCSH
jgi:nicotinate-nucleotide pyrophosphorylase (carboxylating)